MIEPILCEAVFTHHWLVRRRGGERVLEALLPLLPRAPIYTLVHNPDFRFEPDDPSREIYTSFLQLIPHAPKLYPKLLPLMPAAARRLRLPEADLVVCSDACIAKAMPPAEGSRVVCYCHSPVRYAWEPAVSGQYRASLPAPLRPLWAPLMRRIREVDAEASKRVDVFVANSQHVAGRIERFYGRESQVVYPPVDIPSTPTQSKREDFLLCVGHHVPYKRLDLAVEAAKRLRRRLVVIGDGPDVRRLRGTKGVHVQWLGWASAKELASCLERAAALLFPGEEDFGIVPVEAIARGCPVAAYAVGGARETVTPGVSGVWFDEQTVDALVAAVEAIDRLGCDPTAMHASVQRFARGRFQKEMREVLLATLSSA